MIPSNGVITLVGELACEAQDFGALITCCCPSSSLSSSSDQQFWAHWQGSTSNWGSTLHSSALGPSLKPRELRQLLCQGSLQADGVVATCSNPQLMGDRILWIKAPAWHPSDEQFWGTCYSVPQGILSRIDPWASRSLTHSEAILAFPSLSSSPCLLILLPAFASPISYPHPSSYSRSSLGTTWTKAGI